MMDLLKLAERVEALDGPCRETDDLILAALNPMSADHPGCNTPYFTESLDAAMVLVPEGWSRI